MLFESPSILLSLHDLPIFIMSAVGSSLFVVFWLLCVKADAYLMLDVFLLLGTIIPITIGTFVFGEAFTWRQGVGIMLLIAAVYLMCGYNRSLNGKMTIKGIVLLLLCGIASGCTDLSQKIYVKTSVEQSAAKFNFYTYLFAVFVLLLLLPLFDGNEKKQKKLSKKIYIYLLVMAVCLFGNSFFKTIAAKTVSAAQLYPLTQGLAIIVSSLMAHFLFKERLTKRAVFGMCIAFAALMILNL